MKTVAARCRNCGQPVTIRWYKVSEKNIPNCPACDLAVGFDFTEAPKVVKVLQKEIPADMLKADQPEEKK